MMAIPISLTAEEQKLFVKLPRVLTKRFKVTREQRKFFDTEEDIEARRTVARFESPELLRVQRSLVTVNGMKQYHEAIQKLDVSKISQRDQSELYFFLGPELVGCIIQRSLQAARSAADMMGIADLVEIRDILLDEFLPAVRPATS